MISTSRFLAAWPFVALSILLLATPGAAQPLRSFAPLVKAQLPRVVHIKTGTDRSTQQQRQQQRERFGPFQPPEFYSGRGTGFIIDASGLIVTNYHVVEGTERVDVVLSNEKTYRAEVIGTDQRTDLALVKIDAEGLIAVEFGDSNAVEVGDWVIAIGDPLGLNYSVTAGIISAKGRNIFDAENTAYGEFLQTDAAINPGNSGGPLFNLDGKVIGVNTAISSRGQGIGFAVPSNLVVEIVQQLREYGRVVRGWLGVVIQEITPEWVVSVGLPEETDGILVNDIVPNAPASRSDLRKGDLLIAYRGEALTRVPQLQKLVAFTQPGDTAQVQVLRHDDALSEWRTVALEIEIGNEPGSPELSRAEPDAFDKLDIALDPVSNAARRRHGLREGQGLMVSRVGAGGLGQRIGLLVGDIILEVDRNEVTSRDQLAKVLREKRGGRVPILIQRDNRTIYLTLRAADLR